MKFSSTLSLTSAIDGFGCSLQHLGRFAPGKATRYPSYSTLSGPHGQSGRVRKILPPTGIRSLYRPARSEWLFRKLTLHLFNLIFRTSIFLKNRRSSMQSAVLFLSGKRFKEIRDLQSVQSWLNTVVAFFELKNW